MSYFKGMYGLRALVQHLFKKEIAFTKNVYKFFHQWNHWQNDFEKKAN